MTFVVLVLCANAHAVGGGDVKIDSTNQNAEKADPLTPEERIQLDLLSIDQSPYKKKKQDVNTFVYPYKRSLGYRFGAVFDSDKLRDSELPVSIGATYMFFRRKIPRVEIYFNYFSDATAQVGATKRYMYHEPNHFRPFWSWGASLNIEPDERFATATNIDNYQATISAGMEDVLILAKSFRLELQIAAGLENQSAIVYLGSTWGMHP